MPKQYLAIFIPNEGGYEAWFPDLPGCVGSATSIEVLESLLRGAIPIHLRALEDRGHESPQPQAFAKYITVTEKLA